MASKSYTETEVLALKRKEYNLGMKEGIMQGLISVCYTMRDELEMGNTEQMKLMCKCYKRVIVGGHGTEALMYELYKLTKLLSANGKVSFDENMELLRLCHYGGNNFEAMYKRIEIDIKKLYHSTEAEKTNDSHPKPAKRSRISSD